MGETEPLQNGLCTDAPRRFGLAIYGLGRIGSVHFGNLLVNPRVDVLWVVEADVARAKDVLRQHRRLDDVKVAKIGDDDDVWKDERVDAVLVCTPSFTHEAVVKAALTAKKAVFCEKPLAPTIAAIEACYTLAEQADLPCFCAFNRRWDPQVRELRRRVAGDEVGSVRVIKSYSRDCPGMCSPEYIKTSGGIFFDTVVHDIDLIMWLAGGERPRSVYATGHATNDLYRQCDDFDSVVVVLTFPSGVIGVIEVSREAPVGYYQHVEVFGTRGQIQSENKREHNLVTQTMSGVTQEPILTDCTTRYDASYRAEMEHFINVLQGVEKLEVTKDSVLTVNNIALLCRKSVDTGTVINLP